MTIVELLGKVGADNCKVQFIHESLAGAKMRKDEVTEISFFTDAVTPDEFMGKQNKVGVVVWFDADKWPTKEQP